MTHEIDVNLIRTNIRRDDSVRLKKMRYDSKEPLYSVIRRLIDTADTDKADMSFMIEEFKQASASWKDKYLQKVKEFEEMIITKDKEFSDYRKKVVGTMEEFIK